MAGVGGGWRQIALEGEEAEGWRCKNRYSNVEVDANCIKGKGLWVGG